MAKPAKHPKPSKHKKDRSRAPLPDEAVDSVAGGGSRGAPPPPPGWDSNHNQSILVA
jgi:hypothetical protein